MVEFSEIQLSRAQALTAWGGTAISTIGVLYTFSRSGDPIGFAITIAGIGIGAVGNVISIALRQLQSRGREESDRRLKEAIQESLEAKRIADELRHRQLPRRLSSEIEAGLSRTLGNAACKQDLRIRCVVNDAEAWALAEQIKKILEASGFEVDRIVPIMTTPPLTGIRLQCKNCEGTPTASAMGQILEYFSLPVVCEPLVDDDCYAWSLDIGSKG